MLSDLAQGVSFGICEYVLFGEVIDPESRKEMENFKGLIRKALTDYSVDGSKGYTFSEAIKKIQAKKNFINLASQNFGEEGLSKLKTLEKVLSNILEGKDNDIMELNSGILLMDQYLGFFINREANEKMKYFRDKSGLDPDDLCDI